MRRELFPASVLAIGLIAAQVVFTLIVYDSNLSLHHHLDVLKAAGYLVVPSGRVMQTLTEIGPAFWGGLFFTLSIGCGLCLASLALLNLQNFFASKRLIWTLILAVWGFVIYRLNSNGLNFSATLAFVVIPAVAGAASIRLHFITRGPKPRFLFLGHGIALFLIILAWLPHLKADPFVRIRDYLLLPSPLGRSLNDFYYRYTLYPAEVFKSLDQKLLKTCRLQTADPDLEKRIEQRLRRADYLKVNTASPVDLTLRQEHENLLLINKKKIILTSTVKEFLADPESRLKIFSQNCDPNIFFRKATFLSLIVGLPLTCYILMHAVLTLGLFFLPFPALRSWIAVTACLFLGIWLTLPLQSGLNHPLSRAEAFTALNSQNWQERVFALKTLCNELSTLKDSPGIEGMANSPHIAERYWLARSLAYGTSQKTLELLRKLANDPHPNVVCMALFSLGKRGHRETANLILDRLKASDHWYVQRYAYQALKRLEWIQPEFTAPPLP